MTMRNALRSLALLIALQPAIAAAQVPPFTLPPSTVIGRSAQGVGPAQAIPFASLIATMLSGPVSIATVNTNSIIFKGSISGQATVQAQANAGTPTLNLPTISGTLADSAIAPLVLNATTGAMSCPTCLTTSTSQSLFVQSRAAAIPLNLSAVNVIQTGGYATAGDGGGATFKNVGTSPFIDSQVTGTSISGAGSGCTNGTYLGTTITSGSGTTGTGLSGNAVVSGGVLSSFTIGGNGGNGYKVGDLLLVGGITCTTTPTMTVSSVSTPTASFTDALGTHFQIIADQGNFINVRQFGAKVNWTAGGGDAGATNDFTAIQNAYFFASANKTGTTIDAGGAAGAKVIHPAGTSLVCGGSNTLLVPAGVSVEGNNVWASTLKMCDSGEANTTHFVTICDPTTHLACFGSQLHNITLFAISTHASSANISMIYSNNIQQIDFLDRVAIYAGQRQCILLETGFGGAALLGMQNVECSPGNTTINAGITINYGTTLVTMRNVHVEGSSTIATSGIRITGGFVDLVGFHTEGVVTGIEINIPIASGIAGGIVRLHNLSGGVSCTSLVLLQSTNKPGNTIVGQAIQNGCTNTVSDGQLGGANIAAPIVADTLFNP